MKTFWKVAIALLVALPMAAYVAGTLTAFQADERTDRTPITIKETVQEPASADQPSEKLRPGPSSGPSPGDDDDRGPVAVRGGDDRDNDGDDRGDDGVGAYPNDDPDDNQDDRDDNGVRVVTPKPTDVDDRDDDRDDDGGDVGDDGDDSDDGGDDSDDGEDD